MNKLIALTTSLLWLVAPITWSASPPLTKAPVLDGFMRTDSPDLLVQPLLTNINHVFFNRVANAIEIRADQPLSAVLTKEPLADGRVFWRVTLNHARWGLTLPSQTQLKTEINRVWPTVNLVHYKTLDANRIQLVISLPADVVADLRLNGPTAVLGWTVRARSTSGSATLAALPSKQINAVTPMQPLVAPQKAPVKLANPMAPLTRPVNDPAFRQQQLEQQVAQLKAQLAAANRAIQQQAARPVAAPSPNPDLLRELDGLKNALANTRQQLSAKDNDLRALKQQLDGLQQAKAQTPAPSQLLEQQQKTWEQRLNQQAQDAQRREAELQAQLAAEKATITRLEQTLSTTAKPADVDGLKQRLNQQAQDAQRREAELQAQLAAEKATVSRLEQSLSAAAKPADVDGLKQQILLLQTANAQLTQRIKELSLSPPVSAKPALGATPSNRPVAQSAVSKTSKTNVKPVSQAGKKTSDNKTLANNPVTKTTLASNASGPNSTEKITAKPSGAGVNAPATTANKPASALPATESVTLANNNNEAQSFDAVYKLAQTQANQGNWAQAVKTLQGFLATHPDDQPTFQAIGMIYLKAERWADAKLAFSRVTETQPVVTYGLQLKQDNQLPQAEAVLKLASELDPMDPTRLFHLGNVLSAEQKLDEAKAVYTQALTLRPRFPEVSYNLGIILSKLGDQAGAIARLQNYLEWSPNAANTQAVQTYIDRLKAMGAQRR